MKLSVPKYGWARALLILIPFFIFQIIFHVIGVWILGIPLNEISSDALSPENETAIMFFSLLGTVAVLWIFMHFIDKKSFMDLGLQLRKRGKDILVGILVGLFIMAMGYGILSASGELQDIIILFDAKEIFLMILLFVFVAFSEELLTRGYLLRNFMQSMNKYVALAISAIIFAAMHGFNPNMSWFSWLSLFMAGIVLGITYIYTKNLWFPIALHFSWNFFQSLWGFNVSGQDIYSLVEFTIPVANRFNGGAFGFEGSYLSLIADVCVILGAVWIYRRQGKKAPLIDEL